jgi:two-component system nitrate/nitrite response regulator NarL
MELAAPPRVTVVAADPHPLYREAVVQAVRRRPEFELVGEEADGAAALDVIERLRPRVAVVDVALPGLDGHRLLRAVARDRLPTRVVFLSADASPSSVYRAIAGGAAGYLTKRADGRQVCDAIGAVARGDAVFAGEVHAGIAGEIRVRSAEERPLLSQRETEILKLVAAGRSAPEIARSLHLGTATVKSHLASAYAKLDVAERAAAVAEAMRRGLLE